jgi:signal transduction histidine kinase
LLFLTRHDRVSLRESFQPTDLVTVLNAITAEWRPQAVSQHLTFTCDLPKHSIWVMADPNLLRQAVVNLLNNAYRYIPAYGKVQLQLLAQTSIGELQRRSGTTISGTVRSVVGNEFSWMTEPDKSSLMPGHAGTVKSTYPKVKKSP